MRSLLLRFLNELRTAGLSISVSESMDALQAAAAIGVERDLLREALAASLVKTEEDRPLFEGIFARFFAHRDPRSHSQRQRQQHDSAGEGHSSQAGAASPSKPVPRRVPQASQQLIRYVPDTPRQPAQEAHSNMERQQLTASKILRSGSSTSAQEQATSSTARLAQRKALVEKPFHTFDGRDVEAATALVEELSRRLRAHLSRRYTRQKHGRLDFRRTIRTSLARGGVPIDLKFRGRQPGKPDLLALCDVSGSVTVVSDFLLGVLAPATAYFRQVRTFVYVDRLCEVSFEQGHVMPHDAMLDLYARSDFGTVLQHFWQTQGEQLLTRNTIVLILGDARNNRRPPRPDLLARIGERVKTLLWLNPEPQARWDTGDSVMSKYAPVCDGVFACGNLQDLIQALQRTL